MVADVVEASEEQTGRRSEGTLSAGAFLASKSATGLGIFAAGLLLSYAQLQPNARPDAVPALVIDKLSFAYAVCTALLAIATATIALRFPIDRAAHEARLATLRKKAGASRISWSSASCATVSRWIHALSIITDMVTITTTASKA